MKIEELQYWSKTTQQFEAADIKDEDEMSEALGEELEAFCHQLESMYGMTREVEENDSDCENCTFMWTTAAQKIIEQEQTRLWNIGQKYWPGADIAVETMMYKEY